MVRAVRFDMLSQYSRVTDLFIVKSCPGWNVKKKREKLPRHESLRTLLLFSFVSAFVLHLRVFCNAVRVIFLSYDSACEQQCNSVTVSLQCSAMLPSLTSQWRGKQAFPVISVCIYPWHQYIRFPVHNKAHKTAPLATGKKKERKRFLIYSYVCHWTKSWQRQYFAGSCVIMRSFVIVHSQVAQFVSLLPRSLFSSTSRATDLLVSISGGVNVILQELGLDLVLQVSQQSTVGLLWEEKRRDEKSRPTIGNNRGTSVKCNEFNRSQRENWNDIMIYFSFPWFKR